MYYVAEIRFRSDQLRRMNLDLSTYGGSPWIDFQEGKVEVQSFSGFFYNRSPTEWSFSRMDVYSYTEPKIQLKHVRLFTVTLVKAKKEAKSVP